MLCGAISEDGLVDWEHDDHADVHVIRDANAAEFFSTLESSNSRLLGFASDIVVRVQGRGELIWNMGTGVHVEASAKNLLSAVQLRKAYTRLPSHGHKIVYLHDEDHSEIIFRLEKDGYYHTRLYAGRLAAISLVFFYNPRHLISP